MEQWNVELGIRCQVSVRSVQIPNSVPLDTRPLQIPIIPATGFRQGDRKGAALIHGARYGNVPAMSPGNGPCQAETQPGSRLGPALVAAVESFENPVQVGPGDADSRVFNGDSYIVVLGPGKRDLDFSP